MYKPKFSFLKLSTGALAASMLLASSQTQAAPVSVTRQQNSIETSTTAPQSSAFFSQDLAGAAFGPSSGFSSTTQAGTASSVSSSGTISIVGNSTSAGGWIDGNGVPLGITLSYNAAFTVSTPTAGSYLTVGTTVGNGIGIAQAVLGTGNINTTEVLNISAISISSILFSGTLTESGFSFTPGTVNNAGWNRLRSNNFTEATSGTVVTDSAATTWGFGLGTGTGGSGLLIDNNYNVIPAFAPVGAVSFATTAGSGWSLKGVGFKYDVSYDITPVPEPGTIALGMIGGLGLLIARRKKA